MANLQWRKRAWAGSLAVALAGGAVGIGSPVEAAKAPYTHVAISEESICVSYTADFVRAVIALAKSNQVPPTAELIAQVKLAADELSLLVNQAPADFAPNLAAVRAAFSEGYAILASGSSGRFSDPQGSRAQLLAYVSRCEKYPLTTLPGKMRPPDPQTEGGVTPTPGGSATPSSGTDGAPTEPGPSSV